MPYTLNIDASEKRVHLIVAGHVTDRDIQDALQQLQFELSRVPLDGSWQQLIDTSDVISMDEVTTSVVRNAARSTDWPRECLRIIVAPSDLVFGLARMYQIQASAAGESNLHVVRSQEEARQLIAAARG